MPAEEIDRERTISPDCENKRGIAIVIGCVYRAGSSEKHFHCLIPAFPTYFHRIMPIAISDRGFCALIQQVSDCVQIAGPHGMH